MSGMPGDPLPARRRANGVEVADVASKAAARVYGSRAVWHPVAYPRRAVWHLAAGHRRAGGVPGDYRDRAV